MIDDSESRDKLFWHILRRCVLLFAIAVFLNGSVV
jgi:hypothetical protein